MGPSLIIMYNDIYYKYMHIHVYIYADKRCEEDASCCETDGRATCCSRSLSEGTL